MPAPAGSCSLQTDTNTNGPIRRPFFKIELAGPTGATLKQKGQWSGPLVLIGHRHVDTCDSGWAHGSLCQSGNPGDLGPGLEGLGPGGSIVRGGKVIAAEVEEIVDPVMSREKTLCLPG
jgi:hypothetical protein